MKAIFYHVPGPGARELLYIDPQTAQIRKIEARENESINTVVADFHIKYRSAVSLKDHDWERKTREIAADRAKLAAWKEWGAAPRAPIDDPDALIFDELERMGL